MFLLTPRSTRPDTLCPFTTPCRSGSSKPPGRSALGRVLSVRLGGRGGRCRCCLALGVGPGPERGDVRRAQRGVPQDFDASALLAEGGEVGGDGLAGQV